MNSKNLFLAIISAVYCMNLLEKDDKNFFKLCARSYFTFPRINKKAATSVENILCSHTKIVSKVGYGENFYLFKSVPSLKHSLNLLKESDTNVRTRLLKDTQDEIYQEYSILLKLKTAANKQLENSTLNLSNESSIMDVISFEFQLNRLILPFYNQGNCILKDPMNLTEVKDIAKSVMDALHFMHSNGVAHMDVRPANIFRHHESDGSTKVFIGGVQSALDTSFERFSSKKNFFCAEAFASPEIAYIVQCSSKPDYSCTEEIANKLIEIEEFPFASDFFSFGLTLATLRVGQLSFKSYEDWTLFRKNLLDGKFPDSFTESFIELLNALMNPNPSKRTYLNIANLSFLNNPIEHAQRSSYRLGSARSVKNLTLESAVDVSENKLEIIDQTVIRRRSTTSSEAKIARSFSEKCNKSSILTNTPTSTLAISPASDPQSMSSQALHSPTSPIETNRKNASIKIGGSNRVPRSHTLQNLGSVASKSNVVNHWGKIGSSADSADRSESEDLSNASPPLDVSFLNKNG